MSREELISVIETTVDSHQVIDAAIIADAILEKEAELSYPKQDVATLIEVIIRGKLWFPKTDEQMKWFDEGLNFIGASDLMKKLENVITDFTENHKG